MAAASSAAAASPRRGTPPPMPQIPLEQASATELDARIQSLKKEIDTLKEILATRAPQAGGILRLSGSLRSSGGKKVDDVSKKILEEKQAELQKVEAQLVQVTELLAIFNDSPRSDLARLISNVLEANSEESLVPKQTSLDLARNYRLTIDGTEANVEALVSTLGEGLARNILKITNQHLIISMVPYPTPDRNPAIYEALRLKELKADGASEFNPTFQINRDRSMIVSAKLWIKRRDDNETKVASLTATLTIPDVAEITKATLTYS